MPGALDLTPILDHGKTVQKRFYIKWTTPFDYCTVSLLMHAWIQSIFPKNSGKDCVPKCQHVLIIASHNRIARWSDAQKHIIARWCNFSKQSSKVVYKSCQAWPPSNHSLLQKSRGDPPPLTTRRRRWVVRGGGGVASGFWKCMIFSKLVFHMQRSLDDLYLCLQHSLDDLLPLTGRWETGWVGQP